MVVYRETGAYRIKNESDIDLIKEALKKYKVKWKDDVYKAFAKGSYISDCVREQKLLTKYYKPVMKRYVKASYERMISVEESIGFLTDPDSTIHNIKHEIRFIQKDGSVHPKSRELYVAIKELKKANDNINQLIFPKS